MDFGFFLLPDAESSGYDVTPSFYESSEWDVLNIEAVRTIEELYDTVALLNYRVTVKRYYYLTFFFRKSILQILRSLALQAFSILHYSWDHSFDFNNIYCNFHLLDSRLDIQVWGGSHLSADAIGR